MNPVRSKQSMIYEIIRNYYPKKSIAVSAADLRSSKDDLLLTG